jgi:pantoate--beta-alanine ligase
VTTIVTKLFNIVQPHVALFGCKDFQQLALIRRMTIDLDLPVDIVGMPIVREADGLAMSSRNVYLSVEERGQALALFECLRESAFLVGNGEQAAAKVLEVTRQRLAKKPGLHVDYVKICHATTFNEVDFIDHNSVMLLAVKIGKTRLIDNHMLSEAI